jgi:23S rRNA (adenine2503-C2)-methyltransferase
MTKTGTTQCEDPRQDPDRDARRHFLDLTREDLAVWSKSQGQPAFRAQQIIRWIYQGRVSTAAEMTDLPASLREQIDREFVLFTTQIAAHQRSPDGTEKLLLTLADGGQIECVLLRDGPRRSICISSQVGCAMGCVFCASGLDGVQRNLTQGEIVEQMLRLQHLLPREERLSHIVAMGMGEPLANLEGLLAALQIANDSAGLGISARRITISTVGLPAAIDRLAKQPIDYNLAVSLHAPNDALRTKLVPVNAKIGIDAVVDAADRYFAAKGRRLTYEYVLLGGINDSAACARQLVQLLRGRTALLNVIPYNPVAGLPYETPKAAARERFREILEHGGVNVQFRERKGGEIDAACGQLRRIKQADAGPRLTPLKLEPNVR